MRTGWRKLIVCAAAPRDPTGFVPGNGVSKTIGGTAAGDQVAHRNRRR